jgi:uncharacterized protein
MSTCIPCNECGASCAFYRVSFYWGESSSENLGTVPADRTERAEEFLQCMKGTNQVHPRCVCLQGKIGQKVSCSIYLQRSSTCQDFGLHKNIGIVSVIGSDLVRCNEARNAWHLPALTRAQLRSLPLALSIRRSPPYLHSTHKTRH